MKKLLLLAAVALLTLGCNQTNNTMDKQQAALDNIYTRVSVRHFTGEPVAEEQIDALLRAGMAAPTAVNKQPWSFLVIDRPDQLSAIGEAFPNSRVANGASLAIVACGDLDKALEGEAQDYWIQDVSAATENILLAAHAMGLGAVWSGVYPISERVQQARTFFALPDHIVPLCIITVGHPAEQPAVKDKYKPENIHRNRW